MEWPAFAIVAIVGWWQLVTEPPEELAARREERRLASLPKPVAYDTEVLRRELAAHPELVRAFPEVVKAFPELGLGDAALGERASGELPAREVPARELAERQLPDRAPAARAPADRALAARAPSTVSDGEDVVAAPSEDARAYNEMLGRLAAMGKPKTWRNPRGR